MRDHSALFLQPSDPLLAVLHSVADDLHAELLILAREYSPLRRNSKWRTQVTASQPTDKPTLTRTVATVPRGGVTEVYAITDLLHRISLKQNPVLFAQFHRIWALVNPFHIKQISRKVALGFNEFMFGSALGPVPEVADTHSQCMHDLDIDFHHKSGLTFTDFYDSLFEAIDTHCRSKLITEYALLAKKVAQGMEDGVWMKGLELHNKTHILPGGGPIYAAWMLPMLTRGNTLKFLSTPSSPSVRSKPITRTSSTSLISQSPKKPPSPRRDTFLTKIHALTTVKFRRISKPQNANTSTPLAATQSTRSELRVVSKGLKKRLSPLSTRQLQMKTQLPTLLEKVVERRENCRQQVSMDFD